MYMASIPQSDTDDVEPGETPNEELEEIDLFNLHQ